MKNLILIFCITLFISGCTKLKNNEVVFVTGEVIDLDDNQPIARAKINAKSQSARSGYGAPITFATYYTDSFGYFEFSYNYKDGIYYSLECSADNYHGYGFDLESKARKEPYIIKLERR